MFYSKVTQNNINLNSCWFDFIAFSSELCRYMLAEVHLAPYANNSAGTRKFMYTSSVIVLFV